MLCIPRNFDARGGTVSSSPLILTSYIEANRITEGQKAAEVRPFLKGVKSYSGYLTVDKKFDSNLFFWYFPCKNDNLTASAPLVIWLQGGPGASSMFGLFTENGPYVFNKGKLHYRYYSWTNYFNVLYIDNPVGTGFSFTKSDDGYATNQTIIGEHLYEAVTQFLILFPNLQKNGIIISGESYAGKYIPSFAYTISQKSNQTEPKINVKGLFIGNPLISPEHMLHYNEYLFSHGLLDANGQEVFRKREELIKLKIKASKWEEATDLMSKTLFGLDDPNTLFYELTGLEQYFHLLKDKNAPQWHGDFLNLPHIREAVHVGHRKFINGIGMKVFNGMREDIMKSMKPIFEQVIEKYPTLVYSGQLDGICPWYLQEKVFLNLAWSGAWKYYQADRKVFHWNQYLVGYYKIANNFVDVMVRNAGHMVPTDKPQWALGLLRRFSDGYFKSS